MRQIIKLLSVILMLTYGSHLKAQNLNGLLSNEIKTEQQLLNYMNRGTTADQQVTQIGNQNYAQINAKGIEVQQQGNQQQFYYNGTSFLPSNMKVNVTGNNSYVEIMGDNSILNNATINITGNHRTVTIRNYK